MKNKPLETNHNFWFRIIAKAFTDEQFKQSLLNKPDQVLDAEFKYLQKQIIKEIINDPQAMEKVFGDEDPANMEIEEMEERLAAFGYIGF